ncbi:hypothetical protein OAI56_00565 [Amylibacter sp.]|nr:hypothetical protein [Amylibacter sp.]
MDNIKLSLYQTPIAAVFTVFALFPWVSFSLNEMDMQPWSLLVGLIYIILITGKLRISPNYILSFAMMLSGLICATLLSYNFGFLTFRAIYNFFSFFIFYSIFLHIFSKYRTIKFLKVINYIWIGGGVLELMNPGIMEIFGKVRTSVDRGSTSFAPEPSFFAANLIFLPILILVLSNYNWRENKYLLIFNLLTLIFICRSAIGLSYIIVLLCVWLGYHLIRFKPSKVGVRILFSLIISFSFVLSLVSVSSGGTRIISLLKRLVTDGPMLLFKLDASMNERLAHVVFPIYGSAKDFFVPHGVDTFSEARVILEPNFNDFFWYSMNTDKIMSWYGDWLYTLGAFGIVSLVCILWPAVSKSRENAWTFLGISIILLSAIPISYPLIPAVFAGLLVRNISK